MSHFDHAIEAIEDGLAGKNKGLFHGLPKTMRYIPNIQKGNIYLVGGISGSGKSALAVDMFVANAYEDYKNRLGKVDEVKLKIFVWSIEISPEILIAKMICRRLWKEANILTDINYVLSRGYNRLNNGLYEQIKAYRNYFEELEDRVIINSKENPTGIRNILLEYLHNHGTVSKKRYTVTHKDKPPEERETFDRYTSDDEKLHIIGIIDHLGIMKLEGRNNVMFTKKQNIDKMMEYSLDLVRDYKITMVPLQQLNRASEGSDRYKDARFDPIRADFKETSDTTDLAHYILGLCYPQSFGAKDYHGYNLEKLGNRFRGIKIIKNRDGDADVVFGTRFLGEVGEFTELPAPILSEMGPKQYNAIKSITKYTE
jgi:replicative DNA helicase